VIELPGLLCKRHMDWIQASLKEQCAMLVGGGALDFVTYILRNR
jgi:hypothetical protein